MTAPKIAEEVIDVLGRAAAREDKRRGRGPSKGEKEGYVSSSTLSPAETFLLDGAGFKARGIVSGSGVWSVGMALRKWKQNGEVVDLSKALLGARLEALERLADAAKRIGANGVAGVRLDLQTFERGRAHNSVTFTALGTALVDTAPGRQGGVFTSALSGKELYLLRRGGYRPVGMVMGSCVYHIRHRAFARWASSQVANTEMTLYTDALYSARELAMEGMQGQLSRLNADGAVGVKVTQRAHLWGNRVIEFLAIGTAVRRDAPGSQLHPVLGVDLHPTAPA
jgi:uncharacterized protein YbjQ (UPF0145 family)